MTGGMQLLKKHGWKEGTGLGISEQVIMLISSLDFHSLITLYFSSFIPAKWLPIRQ